MLTIKYKKKDKVRLTLGGGAGWAILGYEEPQMNI